MTSVPDDDAFRKFTGECDEARSALRKHMIERGLREEDGWWVYECTRHVNGHTELVMRPMHRELAPPPDLECMCIIDETDGDSWDECRE